MRRPQSQKAAALPKEIERIKSLDLNGLEVQWRNVFGKRAPSSLPRALIVKILIYVTTHALFFGTSSRGFDGRQAMAPTITAKGLAPVSLAVSTVVRTSASAWAAHMAR
jgi:hypothetical protein